MTDPAGIAHSRFLSHASPKDNRIIGVTPVYCWLNVASHFLFVLTDAPTVEGQGNRAKILYRTSVDYCTINKPVAVTDRRALALLWAVTRSGA